MDGQVSWQKDMSFTGVGGGGFPVSMDSVPGPDAVSPMEMVALALAGCTAMDVISILTKKREDVTKFDVKVHADRAPDYPRVITSVVLEYVISGREIQEASLTRAIDLSVERYCPVYAMLAKVFPIGIRYAIYEEEGNGNKRLIKSAAHQVDQKETG